MLSAAGGFDYQHGMTCPVVILHKHSCTAFMHSIHAQHSCTAFMHSIHAQQQKVTHPPSRHSWYWGRKALRAALHCQNGNKKQVPSNRGLGGPISALPDAAAILPLMQDCAAE